MTLIIGLLVGYVLGNNNYPYQMQEMHDEMMDNSHALEEHDEEIISSDGAMQHAMEEMMLDFRGKTGEEYEKAFLKGMIVHHIGAIEMAEQLLEETDRPELVKMANDIITVQNKEVDIMKAWLDQWYN
ncbi:DUF305 domain-containing protein [Candidatus Parcubacteria bacterium]|nr:DUF305 domain-containing protein [Candidatus Parcubacteria bacterium]